MLKKMIYNQKGLTFIELMIAIAIIAIISAMSVLYIRGDIKNEVDIVTDQFAADIRYTRNLAVSRTTFDFSIDTTKPQNVQDLGNIFPPGGYGIVLDKTAGTYKIFADSGIDGADANTISKGYDSDTDVVIRIETLDNSLIKLGDANNDGSTSNYFSFKAENDLDTNLLISTSGKYQVKVDYPGPGYPASGYRGILDVGELSNDGYIYLNLGKSLQEYTPAAPPTPGGKKFDPAVAW